MKILFFIGALNTGGAERQLSVLAKGLSARGHKIDVVTLFPGGKISDELERVEGVKLTSLWTGRSKYLLFRMLQIILSPLRLRRLMTRIDCLYSMLETTNFIAWLATRYNKSIILIWGIRSSNLEGHWKMRLFEKFCAMVSPDINLLISNSHTGLASRLKHGYRPKSHMVIPNGIDTKRFQFSERLRKRLRNELGISPDQPLIGIVGRLNPMKDHQTFLRAAIIVSKEVQDVKFLCAGGWPDSYIKKLYLLTNELKLNDRMTWLGDCDDIVSVYSALDLLVSSSFCCEGFPNVIGEAMSCGLPCVVTDVGDSAMIVDDNRCVTEPEIPEMLAQAIINTCRRYEKPDRDNASRKRIENNYSIERLIDITEQKLCEHCAIE